VRRSASASMAAHDFLLLLCAMISALRQSSHVRGATCRTFRQSVNAHTISTAGAAAAAERPKVLVLAGTTGVGKTAVALELAQMLDGEVVNADSVQARARSRHPTWTGALARHLTPLSKCRCTKG
jgi:Cdc6-like AAA superfamily ATPase